MVFKKVSVLTQDTSRISCAPDIIKNSPKKGPSLLGQYNWIMYFFRERERKIHFKYYKLFLGCKYY